MADDKKQHPADKAADKGREFNKKLEQSVKNNQNESNKNARKNWS